MSLSCTPLKASCILCILLFKSSVSVLATSSPLCKSTILSHISSISLKLWDAIMHVISLSVTSSIISDLSVFLITGSKPSNISSINKYLGLVANAIISEACLCIPLLMFIIFLFVAIGNLPHNCTKRSSSQHA
jgi:hypothetical protein